MGFKAQPYSVCKGITKQQMNVPEQGNLKKEKKKNPAAVLRCLDGLLGLRWLLRPAGACGRPGAGEAHGSRALNAWRAGAWPGLGHFVGGTSEGPDKAPSRHSHTRKWVD